MQTNTMIYTQRLNKGATSNIMRYIHKAQTYGANKYNEIYTKVKQRFKQIQWDIYKG